MESLLQLLRYLDTHPHLYHSTCWLAYCGFAAYLVLFCSDRLQRHRWLASDVFFAAILGIVLLIFRWPGLFYNGELNPDESFEIVAARRLLQHPVFGTGVDGGTAGPLNFYLLCILPLVGLKIDYLSARLVGLVIVWMAVFVQYRTVSLFADRRVARLSIAPLATFFAFSTFWDFVHLSTEHLSLLLFSLGAFLLASAVSRLDRDPKLEVFGLGLVAGMLPMAKLQSILLSIALLICAVVWILRKSRQNSLISPKALLTGLVLGAMCVPVGFVLFTTLTGGFAELFRTFILKPVPDHQNNLDGGLLISYTSAHCRDAVFFTYLENPPTRESPAYASWKLSLYRALLVFPARSGISANKHLATRRRWPTMVRRRFDPYSYRLRFQSRGHSTHLLDLSPNGLFPSRQLVPLEISPGNRLCRRSATPRLETGPGRLSDGAQRHLPGRWRQHHL